MSAVTIAVTDDAARPVAGAAVYIVSGPGSFPDLAAITDLRGEVTFGALDPGEYVFGVTAGARQAQVRALATPTPTTCVARLV
jgi:hypothetical protein